MTDDKILENENLENEKLDNVAGGVKPYDIESGANQTETKGKERHIPAGHFSGDPNRRRAFVR